MTPPPPSTPSASSVTPPQSQALPAQSASTHPAMPTPPANALGRRVDNSGVPRMPSLLAANRSHAGSAASSLQTMASEGNMWQTLASFSRAGGASSSRQTSAHAADTSNTLASMSRDSSSIAWLQSSLVAARDRAGPASDGNARWSRALPLPTTTDPGASPVVPSAPATTLGLGAVAAPRRSIYDFLGACAPSSSTAPNWAAIFSPTPVARAPGPGGGGPFAQSAAPTSSTMVRAANWPAAPAPFPAAPATASRGSLSAQSAPQTSSATARANWPGAPAPFPASPATAARGSLYAAQSGARSGSATANVGSAAAAQLGGTGPNSAAAAALEPRRPSALQAHGRNLTAAAGNAARRVVGRDDEIGRVICILCRCTKNSAMLVGAPGVGKTSIANGVAQRIAAGDVPAGLAGARVVELDVSAMTPVTSQRGMQMLGERLKSVVQEALDSDGQVILFIDDIHSLLAAGNMGAANILKPALARGIHCVGATTIDEHRKYIERDAAFGRWFEKVVVQEPSVPVTIAILRGLKRKFELHHCTIIQDAAIVAAAQLADRYITGRQFPGKAINIVDDACVITRLQADNQLKDSNAQLIPNEAIVSPDQVAQIVSRLSGIPINRFGQDEKVKLMRLADRLQERIIGQKEAVNLVAQAVLRSRVGLDQPGKPIGSFLFLGSTGVGKTELAKALAEQLFDSEKMLIRFDMTEFVGSHSVLRLIGAPPSYIGHEDGGQLTEKVRQRPYSVILFDEIEKADSAVINVFLQLLDDGVLTDGKGKTVDFKNTIIIMTSNLGAEHLTEAMTGEKSMEAARDLVIKEAERHFKPEFLNRLSDIVVFEPLSQDKLRLVVNIQMKGIIARLADKGIALSATEAALNVVLSESYKPHYGARPIGRWLQKTVMTKLAEMLLNGEADADTAVIIDASEDKKGLKYNVEKNARRPDKRPRVESSSDSEDTDNGIDLNAPAAKKMMEGITISPDGK